MLSPLLTTMTWRKLKTFVNSTVSLLLSCTGDPRRAVEDADVIIHLLRTRILPEVEAMRDDAFAVVGEIQSIIIRLALELLCVRGSREREYVILYFSHWVQEGGKWRQSVENSLKELVRALLDVVVVASLIYFPSTDFAGSVVRDPSSYAHSRGNPRRPPEVSDSNVTALNQRCVYHASACLHRRAS